MAARKYDIKDFNARVKRISNPRNDSYYDPDMEMHVPKRVSHEKIRKANKQDSFLSAFLVSMILGGFALMIAQAIRYRFFEVAEVGNVSLFIDGLVALWVVALLSAALRRRKFSARVAQVMGIAAMFVAGHNLIWRWPDEMAILYTKSYVEQVQATTEPQSIVFMGSIFSL